MVDVGACAKAGCFITIDATAGETRARTRTIRNIGFMRVIIKATFLSVQREWVANSQLQRFLPSLDGSDFSLQINERDQLGAKDMTRERSEAEAYCTKTSNALAFAAICACELRTIYDESDWFETGAFRPGPAQDRQEYLFRAIAR